MKHYTVTITLAQRGNSCTYSHTFMSIAADNSRQAASEARHLAGVMYPNYESMLVQSVSYTDPSGMVLQPEALVAEVL